MLSTGSAAGRQWLTANPHQLEKQMEKAGFIGLGIMGKPMAANLLKNSVPLAAFTRSGVPDELTQAGAIACDSPAAVAAQADVLFIMVPDTPDVERVLFGEKT